MHTRRDHRLRNALPSLGILTAILAAGCGSSGTGADPRVVLYCAQDREFAEQVLSEFTRRTGLEVAPKFDTEADKSVSLYTELVQEQKRPRCDVFWNNEILSTIRLQKLGLLDPYASPAADSFPAFARAANHTWTAFAERARVLLVNTNLVPEAERPRSILELTEPRWRGRVALAKPQFGTTATAAACLFEVLGPDAAKNFYRGLRKNGVHVVAGNKQVAVGVGQGQFAVGMTDTDDAIAEVQAGRPVVIVFPDRDRPPEDRMGTLFIPNTVAIIRGGPNPADARQLIDELLNSRVEAALAESDSRQMPLNPNVQVQLPREIETRRTVKAMQVDFEKAAGMWDEVQEFLTHEFARP